ncbi:MAG: S49 family peptidase [Rhodospirillum sp.]|nr:S49 family peptidase [Rhodospirillum sp.]MCF8488847.1 S49 family peptidase [Rhodospirillum sp.]MCF8500650.1 S49 family peptidase [Rhodospirillum sp.]
MRNPFRRRKTLAVLHLTGIIATHGQALNLAGLRPAIDRAFKVGDEVALVLNCPGGSPAQSQLIHDHIRLKAEKTGKAVTTFVEDMAASGGYWIALAGDAVHALPTSLVGSIGVISAGFGFTGALEKLGVERRVITAGQSKSRLDPFRPVKPEDAAWLKDLQEQIHGAFIAHVKTRRTAQGAPPREDADLFTGEVWLGERARTLGLVDGLDSLTAYAERRNLRIKDISRKRGFLRIGLGLSGGDAGGAGLTAQALTAQILDGLDQHLKDRALRAGLGG